MRKIEDIKADIKQAELTHASMKKNRLYRTDVPAEKQAVWKFISLNLELVEAITSGIPLDRIEEICNAEKDGRCLVLGGKPVMPKDCKMNYEADALGIGRCGISEEGCEGYAGGGEPHDNCKYCEYSVGYDRAEAEAAMGKESK